MPLVQLIVRLAITLGAMFYSLHKIGPPISIVEKKKWMKKKQ